MKSSDSSTFVASLAKGLEVIKCFGPTTSKLSLSEVAEMTGFTRATARRFLLTLVELGYAVSDGKYFELTPKILCLGQAYLSSLNFWESARIYISDVTKQTNESCSLGVLDGQDIVYVARSAAPHRIMSVGLYVGARLPAYATSMGQIALANLCPAALNAYIDKIEFQRHTSRTIIKPDQLRKRLSVVREHGYALVDQELEIGLRSIAVPLRDRSGDVIAAINVSAHSARISKTAMIREYLPYLRDAAQKIESGL